MKIIELNTGEEVKVDDEDFDELSKHKWHIHKSGEKRFNGKCYAARSQRIDGKVKTIRMHRQIMDCPDGMEVDHKNRNPLDNQRSNLEVVTKEENIKRRWHGKRKAD